MPAKVLVRREWSRWRLERWREEKGSKRSDADDGLEGRETVFRDVGAVGDCDLARFCISIAEGRDCLVSGGDALGLIQMSVVSVGLPGLPRWLR